jgi:hypothetical protein
MRTERVAGVMVHVSDVQAGIAWYSQAFPQAKRYFAPGTDFEVRSLCGVQIEVVAADTKVSSGAAGTVVYWEVSDFKLALSHLLGVGAVLYRGPLRIEAGQQMCQVHVTCPPLAVPT